MAVMCFGCDYRAGTLHCDQCDFALCRECNALAYFHRADPDSGRYVFPCLGCEKTKCNRCWLEFCGQVMPRRFCHACLPYNERLCGLCDTVFTDARCLSDRMRPCTACGDAVRICNRCVPAETEHSVFYCDLCGHDDPRKNLPGGIKRA